MIFSNDTTGLSGSRYIPMAEGYDCSYGTALALVESARNDYKMFRAMLDVEARAINIQRESAGYVQESEYVALAEAAGAGIWAKIKELFSKLLAKIKAIFHTFISKIDGIFKSDKAMVKKYGKEVLRKSHIGNLEVKWRTVKADPFTCQPRMSDVDLDSIDLSNSKWADAWKEDADDREKYFINETSYNSAKNSDSEDFQKEVTEYFVDDDESTEQIKDIKNLGGMRAICNYLETAEKKKKDLERLLDKNEKNLNKLVKKADEQANSFAKATKAGDTATSAKGTTYTNGAITGNSITDSDTAITTANHIYEMSVSYQNICLKENQGILDACRIIHAQYKAAFMKAIAANDKKLEESAAYLDAVEEEAKNEVEDVILGSIKDVDLTTTNNASLNVLDSDVSNDPDKLVYADDPDYDEARTSGSVDSTIVGKESAYFAAPLW